MFYSMKFRRNVFLIVAIGLDIKIIEDLINHHTNNIWILGILIILSLIGTLQCHKNITK